MNYILTDRGIDALKECGLDKVVDKHFDKIESELLLGGFIDDEKISEYIGNHRVHPIYREKKKDKLGGDDEFRVYSFSIPNMLVEMKELPENLSDSLMTAVGVYALTQYNIGLHGKRGYSWRNERFLTHLFSDVDGDFHLSQFDHVDYIQKQNTHGQTFLFEGAEPLVKTLVKRLERGVSDNNLIANYCYWMDFLQHLIYFCCQTGMEVPFRRDYLDVFYKGEALEEAGETIEQQVRHFKYVKEQFKEGKNVHLYRDCLPKYPGFAEQVREGWGLTKRIGECQAFIMDGNLVYCEKQKDGPVNFAQHGMFSKPKVVFTPDMIKEAILGVMSVIFHGGGRNLPQDPGLIMKHFPYFLFENI